MRSPRFLAAAVAAATAALVLAGCGGSSDSDEPAAGASSAAAGDTFPVSVTHAFGTTTIDKKPERVATVAWANHEVPLALGVVPVGIAKANFGDEDGDGLLPWVNDKLKSLNAKTPVLFDENDGIDFEAVADTNPDVILAAYSGLTKQDYDTLSQIAPTVAFPKAAWATAWRDSIKLESQALGLSQQGDALIADIEKQIKTAVDAQAGLAGKTAVFLTHVDPTDLSQLSFYTPADTRTAFFEDLGLKHAPSMLKLAAGSDKFSLTHSAEQAEVFNDVDIIVSYGDKENKQLATLQKDPLVGKIPAIKRGSVVFFPGDSELATAANPTPLSLSYVLDDYVKMLGDAAGKVS